LTVGKRRRASVHLKFRARLSLATPELAVSRFVYESRGRNL